MELSTDLYDEIAWNIVSGNGYRVQADTNLTMLRSPGFVFVLVPLFYFFGKSLLAIQILNFLLFDDHSSSGIRIRANSC